MYYPYFGLKEAPFSMTPNPECFLTTGCHQEALMHLDRGIESDTGVVVLTADEGMGKTTVCHRFLSKLPRKNQVAFIASPCFDGVELLHAICKELGIRAISREATLRQLTDKIHELLLENHSRGTNTVLLIDEAHQLYKHVLELINVLADFEQNAKKLLKIILVGQPELNDILAKPNLKKLSEKITVRYHMNRLAVRDVSEYIDFRLRAAGYTSEKIVFSPGIVKQLFVMSEGIPRRINMMCDRALLEAHSENKKDVNKTILKKAYKEVFGKSRLEENRTPPRGKWWWLFGGIIATALVVYYHGSMPPLVLPSVFLPQSNSGIEVVHKEHSILPEPKKSQEAIVTPASKIDSVLEPPKQTQSVYYRDKQKALAALIQSVVPSVKTNRLGRLECTLMVRIGWQCRGATVQSWEQFKHYNRPAIMTLNESSQRSYVAIVGLGKYKASVLTEEGVRSIPLTQLEEDWQGDLTYLWQPPSGFTQSIDKNSSEALIIWLAEAFADIDGHQKALAGGQYNELLQQRISAFQRKYRLKADGKAGVETLLKLNEERGVAVTLEHSGD